MNPSQRDCILGLLTMLPDPPTNTRLGWTPWEIEWTPETGPLSLACEGVFRFGFVQDRSGESDEWRGLAERLAISWRTIEQVYAKFQTDDDAVRALCELAATRMVHVEREMERVVPLYVAERLVRRGA